MSKKVDSNFDENVEKIATALDEAVPEGSNSFEVVYALCILLAHIYSKHLLEKFSKIVYVSLVKVTIKSIIDENENK